MIEKVLLEVRRTKMTLSQWMLGFVCILFVRFIFESLSSPTSTGVIPSDPYTLIHYGLFFLSVTLGTSCIVGYFTKDYTAVAKISLFGLPVIWLAPLIDIVLSFGKGYKMTYIFDSGNRLIFDFFTFFGSSLTNGATYGIRMGIIIILIGIGWYVWLNTKNLFKTMLAVIFSYLLGFIMASMPGIIHTISHLNSGINTSPDILNYLEKILSNSTISHNTLREGVSFVSSDRLFELEFDKFMSQILFIISLLFGTILLWKIDHKKFLSIIKNLRPERVNFYLASLFCGIGFAYINNLGNPFTWVDIFGVGCLIISFVSLWMYAVHTNDIYDLEIDKISNPDRPLIKKEVGIEDMRETGYVWLGIALIGSWSAGFYPFFMSLVYVSCSYIYSAPPLRLRRFPLLPSFLIAVACLGTVLSGFFFISIHKEIQAFPMLLSIGIIIMVTLAINFKDLKDIEGDKALGIVTLPILFGKNGITVVGLCFALSILLVPIFLSFYFLYIIALPASIIGFKLITKTPYREKPIFILRFVFLTLIAILYLGAYWIARIYHIT